MDAKIPETLSNVQPLPAPKPGEWQRRNRRARSNIPGARANTLPPVIPGEKIFRIVPDAWTLRRWGRRNGFDVKDKGPVAKEVREGWESEMKQNGSLSWTVRVISYVIPGRNGQPDRPAEFYQVRQGMYVRRTTTDWEMVKRELGAELHALLTLDKK